MSEITTQLWTRLVFFPKVLTFIMYKATCQLKCSTSLIYDFHCSEQLDVIRNNQRNITNKIQEQFSVHTSKNEEINTNKSMTHKNQWHMEAKCIRHHVV